MISIIERADMPGAGGLEKKPIRVFAERTVGEFSEIVRSPGIVEVTDWPKIPGMDEIREAAKARDELDRALYHMMSRDKFAKKVKAFRIRNRVFLERMEA